MSPAGFASKTRPATAAVPKIGNAYQPSPMSLVPEKNVPSPVGFTPSCQAFCIVVSKPVLAMIAPAPKAAVRQTRFSGL